QPDRKRRKHSAEYWWQLPISWTSALVPGGLGQGGFCATVGARELGLRLGPRLGMATVAPRREEWVCLPRFAGRLLVEGAVLAWLWILRGIMVCLLMKE